MTGSDRQLVHKQLESQLSVLWRQQRRRLSAVLAGQAGEGLELPVYGLLGALYDAGDVRGGDLAEWFGLDKSTVSRQVAHMERLGLIERVPDPQDGRARLIHITPKGAERVDRLREARGTWLREALQDWPTGEVDDLVDLLSRLNISLGNAES